MTDQPGAGTRVQISDRSLPLHFEANYGQTHRDVDFIARGSRYTIFLTPREAVLMLRGNGHTQGRGQGLARAIVLRLKVVGAAQPHIVGLERLPGSVNYIRGSDPVRWRTNIPIYEKVRYHGIYPGIDIAYYGNQHQLEYDFIVRPGADPESIVLGFEGAEKIEVDEKGDLLLHIAGGAVRHQRPAVYQEVDGARREIAGGYSLKGAYEVGFTLADYDKDRPLVIDPVLFYSSYLGGVDDDDTSGITVDSDGFAYVTGGTGSIDFPTTAGAVQASRTSLTDTFVTKLDPAGAALVYATYLGGAGNDEGRSIAVDGAGNAYIVGGTSSFDFPTTPGAFQSTHTGVGADAFITKLNSSGSALVYSTYLGGADDDEPESIAIDASGNAYVTGEAASADFPITAGSLRTTLSGVSDAFVTKLDASGSALLYSTYLGGGSGDDGRGIAVDSAGNAYVTGETLSVDFPTTAGAFQVTLASNAPDAYVTKLNLSGSALLYSTYLGGTRADRGFAIKLDALADPNAYVAGRTLSTDFPTTAGAFQVARASNAFDAFVTKVNPTGSALLYSTYIGGSGEDAAHDIAVNPSGEAYITGQTFSTDFPITADALQATRLGSADAFVTRLNSTGSAPVYSTYLGGGGLDNGFGIALDAAESAYVTGETLSTDFPTTGGAFDTTFNGIEDAFVAKIANFGPATSLALAPTAASTTVGTEHCVTATARDAAGVPVRGVTVRFTVSGAHSLSSAVKTDAGGQATFCYAGTVAGDDSIAGFADTNHNNTQDFSDPGNTVIKTWAAGPLAALTLTPKTAATPVNTQHCVTARTTDAFGNSVPGGTVLFTVTGVVATTGAVPTDTTARATFCYAGPAQPGSDTITAFADTNNTGTQDPGEPGDTAAKTWFGPPATLTLTPKAITNAVSTQHCLVATVRDTAGNAVPGVAVPFSVTGSVTTAGSATTDASGQATFCYMGPAQPGSDTIVAFADANATGVQDPGEPGDTATKNWVNPPATLTLAPTAETTTVGTQHCVTAETRDAAGNPVAGVTMRFTITGAHSTTGAPSTDASGRASFCYTGTRAGDDTITVFADANHSGTQDPGEPGGTATKTWTAPSLTLAPSPATSTVNTQHCVTATARDDAGNPIVGVPVRFAVTGAHSTSGTATTDANGQAPFCYTGITAGNDTLAAFADTNHSGTQDPGEPGNTATTNWSSP